MKKISRWKMMFIFDLWSFIFEKKSALKGKSV